MREVAVIAAARTAVGKAKRGSFKDTRPDDLIGATVKDGLDLRGEASRRPGFGHAVDRARA